MIRLSQWARQSWLVIPWPAFANTAAVQSNPGIDPTLLVIGVGIGAAVGAFGGYYVARKSRGKKNRK